MMESPTISEPTMPMIDESGGDENMMLGEYSEEPKDVNKGTAVFSGINTASARQKMKDENVRTVFFPWSYNYKMWWGFTVFCAVLTFFFETYQIAFGPGGLAPFNDASSIIEYVLIAVFVVDILINCNLAFYNAQDEIVYDHRLIVQRYMSGKFWIDLVGVLPFYSLALGAAGEMGTDSQMTQLLGILRLVRLVRLHRLRELFEILHYSTRISLLWLTLTRNFAVALAWSHFAACVMFFIARQYNFDDDQTWLGSSVYDMTEFERYITSLYWSVTTVTTVGYGDWSPVNAVEQIWGMCFMLLNIILTSWIIASITLLVSKDDEKTGEYRETLQILDQYSTLHSFDKAFKKRLKTQLKLDFNNREIADEQVLQHFPTSVRRRVLRRLYLPSLMKTNLMKGVRQQFVDSFLITCNVEIFSPGEDILLRGSIAGDLYLLVGGIVELRQFDGSVGTDPSRTGSMYGSEYNPDGGPSVKQMHAGDFVNEVGFFTDSPQIETVRTVTVCKTLTMSRSAYKTIADDHPGSVGRILQNLLAKVEAKAKLSGQQPSASLPTKLEILRAGSMFDISAQVRDEVQRETEAAQNEVHMTAVQDLVKMHIEKQKDDHTTRFLFAASRGDTNTISLMCDQGFDPNSADYDKRTALMVAAMKGNADAVLQILDYGANPNLTDMHGSSALYEAARNGHEETMDVLLQHNGNLCMSESLAASTLCQTVYDGDILTLKRLLRAKIQVNAADYDKRTALHIAAAEGNVMAVKVLVEHGSDVTLKDRWNNSVHDEARASHSGPLLDYLKSLK